MHIPARCLPLLEEQRTHYKDIKSEYGAELQNTFDTFREYLPNTAENILDIGSGMAGIDVFLGKHYPGAILHLLDKQGKSPKINAGFNASADQFAHYNDFDGALELLTANGVENPIVCHDIGKGRFPDLLYDVVISLLSWGFHYPIQTYAPRCRGVMIVDVRKGTGGEDELAEFGETIIVHESRKFRRVVVSC